MLSGMKPKWSLWKARDGCASVAPTEGPDGAYDLVGHWTATTGWSGPSWNSTCSTAAPSEGLISTRPRKLFAAPGWNPPLCPGSSRPVSRPRTLGLPRLESIPKTSRAGANLVVTCDGVIPAPALEPMPPGCVRQAETEGLPLDPFSLESREIFEELCVRKYSSLCRAWRLLLDPKGVGRVSFHAFCDVARSIGWHDVARLWSALDQNRSGFLSMDEWDPASFGNLMEFRRICYREYAGMESAFTLALDATGSRTANPQDLHLFCERHGFEGNVKHLMQALDVRQLGFFTVQDLAFLAKWQGERAVKTTPHFELKSARLWAPSLVRRRHRKPTIPPARRKHPDSSGRLPRLGALNASIAS